MADLVEEVPDVELHDEHEALREAHTNALHRLRRRPLRPEPERTRQEIRLEHRFQHQLRRLLDHAITNRRDTQRPDTAWFRDLPTPHRRRTISPVLQVPL